MKANYGKMIVGVIIGIMAAVNLTLNFWGVEWYKIVISTVVGVIIGMLISDYHITVTIFKTGLQTAANNSWKRAERIKNGEISREQQHDFDISIIRAIYVSLILVLAVLMVGVVIEIIYGLNFLKIEKGRYMLIMMPMAGIFLRIYFLIISALEFDNWAKKLDRFQIEEIWNKGPHKHGKNSLTYDYVKNQEIGFAELTVNMSFKEIMDRILVSAKVLIKHGLISDWSGIKSFFKVFAVILLAIILLLTTSLPILPFWVIKQISKHGQLLNVATAITIGSVIGSLIHSQLIGLGSGLGFLVISYLIERLFKEVNLFYMFNSDGKFQKLARSV